MKHYISVDLGQSNDFTAVSIGVKHGSEFHIRHLERLPLGTSYPAQVERITRLYSMLGHPFLIVDRTGVGRPVFDLLKDLNPVGISITGGMHPVKEGKEWNIPKRDLIGALVCAFQGGKFKIARSLQEADTLVRELSNFKIKITGTGHDTYEGREGVHDDLVLSVAMAVYCANAHSTIPHDKIPMRIRYHTSKGFDGIEKAIGFS